MSSEMMAEDKLRYFLKRVTADLHETRRRLKEIEDGEHEPIAIVGMACRFPGGVGSPEDLWDLVAGGRDADLRLPRGPGLGHREPLPPGPGPPRDVLLPRGRVPRRRGGVRRRRSSGSRRARRCRWTRSSGCCSSPRGRRSSGRASTRSRCAAAATGVFVGVMYNDYGMAAPAVGGGAGRPARHRHLGQRRLGPGLLHAGPGGPGGDVDTACSSSLVALHLACQSLRSGESTLALAGGVTVMADARYVRRVQPAARPGRRRALQGVRGRTRTAPAGARASACCWSSGSPTRGATGTRCSRWSVAARSTRTAPRTASPRRTAPRSSG